MVCAQGAAAAHAQAQADFNTSLLAALQSSLDAAEGVAVAAAASELDLGGQGRKKGGGYKQQQAQQGQGQDPAAAAWAIAAAAAAAAAGGGPLAAGGHHGMQYGDAASAAAHAISMAPAALDRANSMQGGRGGGRGGGQPRRFYEQTLKVRWWDRGKGRFSADTDCGCVGVIAVAQRATGQSVNMLRAVTCSWSHCRCHCSLACLAKLV